MTELANEPMVALKGFLASPVKGVPLVNGAVQGITDAFEPDLTTEQRVKRIAIAAGTSAVIAAAVGLAPEAALGTGAVIALGLVASAVIGDGVVKPVVFQALDLNPHKAEAGEGQPP